VLQQHTETNCLAAYKECSTKFQLAFGSVQWFNHSNERTQRSEVRNGACSEKKTISSLGKARFAGLFFAFVGFCQL
jgi:hypothetical protein